jgi:tetratricopeptide (TPR) repeat protein
MREVQLIALFAIFTTLLYANSLTGDYVMDDTFLVRDNTSIESFSNLISFFTSGDSGFGRPIRLLSLYIDTALFGKRPVVYHSSNVLYYLVYCILIYFFCQTMFNHRHLSVIVTLLFITHPLHTEGVSYISGRKDILGGLFSIACLLYFVRYLETRDRRHCLLLGLFFLLAIASKEIYAVVAFLVGAIAWSRGVHLSKHKVLITTLMGAVVVFISYVLFFRNRALFDYLNTIPIYGNNQGVNIATAAKICAYNLYLVFHPFSLSADYSYNALKRIDYTSIQLLISTLTLLICAGGAYFYRHRNKPLSFGLLWVLLCLIPVSQIIPYPEVISERSLILLSFGSCLVIGSLLVSLPKRAGAIVLVGVLLAFSITTINRNRDWRDNLSLWQSTVRQEPDCSRARYNFGVALVQHGHFHKAEKQFNASLAINPLGLITVPDYSFDAMLNLGNVYVHSGDYNRARDLYRQVLRHRPGYRPAQRNLELVNRLEKRVEEGSDGVTSD